MTDLNQFLSRAERLLERLERFLPAEAAPPPLPRSVPSPGRVSMVVESSPMVTVMVSVPSRCGNRSRRRSCSHSCRWNGWRPRW